MPLIRFPLNEEQLREIEQVLSNYEKYHCGTAPKMSVREVDAETEEDVTLYFGNEESGVELFQDGSTIAVGG